MYDIIIMNPIVVIIAIVVVIIMINSGKSGSNKQ